MKLSENQALYRLAAYCSKGERCLQEVRRKLAGWELHPDEAARIEERLVKERFVDEERFALAFVRDKSRFGKWGRVKIAFELRRKQLKENVIRDALAQLPEEESDGVLRELLEKKSRTVKADDERERWAKLMRFGIGKGYQADEVARSLKGLLRGGYDDELVE